MIIDKWYYSGDLLGTEGKRPVSNIFGEHVDAMQVNVVEINSSNCSRYNCGPNAS